MAIAEVRRWSKEAYQQVKKEGMHQERIDTTLSEALCWTIFYDGDKEYNLVGPDEETTAKWMDTLSSLVSIVRAVHQENEYYLYNS